MRLILVLVFCIFATSASASEATDLAQMVVETYGGADSIERREAIEQSGILESYRYGKKGTVTRVFSRPDKLRVEIQIPGEAPESRILNGEQGWRDGKEVPPMMAKAMFLQAARLDLPYLIMKAGESVKMFGPINSNDERDLKGLEISMEEGLRLVAVIDAKTGYIVSSHGMISVNPHQSMEFTTVFSGYQETDGMVFASEEAHFVQNQPTGRTVLNRSEVVQEIPDSVFHP